MGAHRGDIILVFLRHTPHLYYSFLGAILAGAIPSFMPPPSSKQRANLYWNDHDLLFKRIEPALIVTHKDDLHSLLAAIPSFSTQVLIADEECLSDESPLDIDRSQPDDLACLQHSSGTTGLKKGVMLTHRAVIDQVCAYSASLEFTGADSIASWLPLYHDMGFIACFMASVLQGSSLVSLDPFEWVVRPRILLDAIERYRTTVCWLPNFAFGHTVNAVPANVQWDLSSTRAFINCSEPARPSTFRKFLDRFASCGVASESLQVCYATAENVFGVTQTQLGRTVRALRIDAAAFSESRLEPAVTRRPALELLSCGAPLAGVKVEVQDAAGLRLPNGEIGEITVHSPFLFAGYYMLPEKTLEKLENGWYATGDRGFVLDGELFVAGRTDDLLIISGRNYYAHEIENVVNSVPGIRPGRCVALGVDNEQTDALAVVLLVECVPHADLAGIGPLVRREVFQRLGLMVHAVMPMPEGALIKTTSGKISRSRNLQLYSEQMSGYLGGPDAVGT